jgi:hypothetical protein
MISDILSTAVNDINEYLAAPVFAEAYQADRNRIIELRDRMDEVRRSVDTPPSWPVPWQSDKKTFYIRIKRLFNLRIFLEATNVEEAKTKLMDYVIAEIRVAIGDGRTTLIRQRSPGRAARMGLWTAHEEQEDDNCIHVARN